MHAGCRNEVPAVSQELLWILSWNLNVYVKEIVENVELYEHSVCVLNKKKQVFSTESKEQH